MKRLWITIIAVCLLGTGLNIIGCSDASMGLAEIPEDCIGDECNPDPEPIFDPVVIIEEKPKDVVVADVDVIDCYDFRSTRTVILSKGASIIEGKAFSVIDGTKPVTIEGLDMGSYDYQEEYTDPLDINIELAEVVDAGIQVIDGSRIDIENDKFYTESIKEQIEDFQNSRVDIYSDDPYIPYEGEMAGLEPIDEDCVIIDELSAAKDELEVVEDNRIEKGILYIDSELVLTRKLINIISAKEAECKDIVRMECIIVDEPSKIRKHEVSSEGSKYIVDIHLAVGASDTKIIENYGPDLEKHKPNMADFVEVPEDFGIDLGDPPPVEIIFQ